MSSYQNAFCIVMKTETKLNAFDTGAVNLYGYLYTYRYNEPGTWSLDKSGTMSAASQ